MAQITDGSGALGISKRMNDILDTVFQYLPHGNKPPTKSGLVPLDLSVAENWLLRPEILEICRDAIAKDFNAKSLCYPEGLGGDPALLAALSSFFNTYFSPSIPVTPDHITAASGTGNCLDALACSICEPGDSILVPGPFFSGFGPHFQKHAQVGIITVNAKFSDSLRSAFIPALESAYANAADPKKIKGLVMTNPHNPFGQCYPKEVLKECMKFCQERGLHYISDEVYALSLFETPDFKGNPFVSALSLVDEGTDGSRVHVLWSASKDFGCSGVRMGCIITQKNPLLRTATAVTTFYQLSSLTSTFLTTLLKSPSLPSLIQLNSKRLAESYELLSSALKEIGLEFQPANAGPFIFVKIASGAMTWDDEEAVVELLREAGLKVCPGKDFNGISDEKGWARITFAVPEDQLREGIARLKKCFAGIESGN